MHASLLVFVPKPTISFKDEKVTIQTQAEAHPTKHPTSSPQNHQGHQNYTKPEEWSQTRKD